MNRIIFLICFLMIFHSVKGQDFKFTWQIWPFSPNAYSVTVLKKGNQREFIVKETLSNDSTIAHMRKVDCDSIKDFLDSYTFTSKGNSIRYPFRKYLNTVFLPDSNRVIIDNDTVRSSSIRLLGYYFDADSNKYYEEWVFSNIFTDGNNYEGEYVSTGLQKRYHFHSARISPEDYELNKMIFRMIYKYDKKNNYSILKRIIESDKPGEF